MKIFVFSSFPKSFFKILLYSIVLINWLLIQCKQALSSFLLLLIRCSVCIWRSFFWPRSTPQSWLIAAVTAVDASRHALPHRRPRGPSSHLPDFALTALRAAARAFPSDVAQEMCVVTIWECCEGTGCCKMSAVHVCRDFSACLSLGDS